MSGLGAGLGGLGAISELLGKILKLFEKTPAQVQHDRQSDIGETHEAVQKGSHGDFSDMDNLP